MTKTEVRGAPEQAIVAFAGAASPPAAARERAALSLMDLVVCMLAGGRTDAGRRLATLAPEGPAGSGRPGSAGESFWLAALGHVQDLDDNHDTIGGHPSTVILPALLHEGRRRGAAISTLLDPYVVGVEVMAAISRSLGRRPYTLGWHPTTVYGTVGAAAALAAMAGAGADVATNAIGLACGMASGTKAAFGTDGKALQVGHAARSAIEALDLARTGFSGAPLALSDPQGLGTVLGASPRWDELNGLGDRWEILDPGIVFKRFGCCATTHAPAEATLALRSRVGVGRSPERIVVRLPAGRISHVDRPHPVDGTDAKFSVHYVVATAWETGAVRLDDFEADWQGSARRYLMEKVAIESLPPRSSWPSAAVTVEAAGESWTASVAAARGHEPGWVPTLDDLADKASAAGVTGSQFHEMMGLVDSDATCGDLISFIRRQVGATAERADEPVTEDRRESRRETDVCAVVGRTVRDV